MAFSKLEMLEIFTMKLHLIQGGGEGKEKHS